MKRKIQIVIDERDANALDALKISTGCSTAELLQNSIALYRWAVSESLQRKVVMSAPRQKIRGYSGATKPVLKGVNSAIRN